MTEKMKVVKNTTKGKVEKKEDFTFEDALMLGQAVVTLLNTTNVMPSKLAYALTKNEKKLSKYAQKYRKEQYALLEEFGVKKEDGNFQMKDETEKTPEGNPFFFKTEDGEQKYEAKATALLKEVVDIDFYTVDAQLFENLTINAQQNRDFDIIVDTFSI